MNDRERLRQLFLDRGFKEQSGNSEWLQTQCPFCGDSPNPLTAHLNVRVSLDNKPLQIVCYQPDCQVWGFLEKEHLLKFRIYDDSITKFVTRQRRASYRFMMNAEEYTWHYHWLQNPALEYIHKRTGIMLDYSSVSFYKIILDIGMFIQENSVAISEKDAKFINDIGWNYVGFVNKNSTQVRLRQINDNYPGPKFSTVTLVDVPFHEPYGLDVVDDLNTDLKHIHIGEGAFDVINARSFFSIPDARNEFYSLNSIKALVKSLKSILNKDRNVKLYFYLDEDISEQYIYYLLHRSRMIYRIKNPIVLRRNLLAKDFGDIREAEFYWKLSETEVDMKEVEKILNVKKKRKRRRKR